MMLNLNSTMILAGFLPICPGFLSAGRRNWAAPQRAGRRRPGAEAADRGSDRSLGGVWATRVEWMVFVRENP